MAKAADPLAEYNAKRNFAKTLEPAGTLAPGHGNRFVVQKHDATRLHWDFRLEMDGVLKSWAVTRGPSLNPDDKRLAVRTEDHPLDYGDFEGTIPQKEYGGGTVMLWDSGTWSPIKGKKASDVEKGHLHFVLDGERMKGEWSLIRLRGKKNDKRENWLLRKIDDTFSGGSDLLVETALTSVKTGRSMQQIANGEKGETPRPKRPAPKLTKAAPKFRDVQLATLVDSVPSGRQWLHEVKYDGYRALISTGKGGARVFTRSGLDWSEKFPGVVEAANAIPHAALIDGEIVAFKDGKPDFSTLQAAISDGGDMTCFAFDLLERDGEDLTGLPQVGRKEELATLLSGIADERIRYAEHVLGAGEKLFEAMCAEGLEGVVSKKVDAPYRGTRSKNWLKIKCTKRQEFVIVGWSQSSAKGRPFSSLLLAVNAGGDLRYAGRVGTGFDADTLDDLSTKMERIGRKTPAVEVPKAAAKGAHWVTPKLVAEIAFAEFTAENVVRHASFLGLRGDKDAEDVVAETPAKSPGGSEATGVKISHPDRVTFPDSQITKGELADYYADVAGLMLPWIARRPISLVRCPQGRARQCFFQKHDAGSFGKAVHAVDIEEKDGRTEAYLYIDDATGLLQCVQMGTIEFHGWGSLAEQVETPDRMVFDLDPDEGLDFGDVKKAAEDIKQHLADIGLTSFAMLTGGKGIHVIAPMSPGAEWPEVKSFAERFSRALAQAEPDRFTATMSKAKRKGRIFIDWLRNQRGATAVMPYVARAREGAPVAAPISWTELKDIKRANRWHIGDVDTLIERANGRALAGWGVADQVLPDV
ncbi:DNA ligase D [Stakelama sp. CBK3Z-3]|uniref:DNA ligase (ATP) n=1 Tax=Stakelama flava TaxID=2860338 RepID=A0ABS6XIS0_9SPHN|nr:DNA ligase D [Stakelama flava]MBW4330072.1 DNA ligase D [Stakelama flava]